MTRFYLIRHGQKTCHDENLSELTALGHRQAEVTGRTLAKQGITRIIASPIKRAKQTAEHIAQALKLPLEIDQRLQERIAWFGADCRQDEFQHEWDATSRDRFYQPQGGQSSYLTGMRVQSLMSELIEAHVPAAALVSHTGAISDTLENFFGDNLQNLPGAIDSFPDYHLTVANCSLTILDWDGRRTPQVIALADTSHLTQITS